MSIKKNFAFNSVLTASGFIFPLITYPYVSRVLGVTNIGICNFIDSIINYFILFSTMGISAMGIREIAQHKDDKEKLQKTFSSLLFLHIITTAIMVVVLTGVTIFTPKLYIHRHLVYIGIAKLIFNLFLTEWFFSGMENFKYITIRSIAIKVIYVVLVLVFVKEADDYPLYYLFMVISTVLNGILSNSYRRKWVRFSFKNLNIKPYLKSFFTLGIYIILTNMYTSFNVAYLGFVTTPTDVGYYTTATKLFGIMLSVFTAFTAVMLPRISSLVKENKFDEIKRLTTKSYDALILFCLPIIIIFSIFAPQLIKIISGPGFEGAITPMRIIMPLLLVLGIAQILVLQILMPMKKDKIILINSIIGAVIGLALNISLVGRYKSVGAAIVYIGSEVIVTIVAQYYVRKETGIGFPLKSILKNIAYMSPVISVCICFQWFIPVSDLLGLFLASGISFIYIGVLQVFWLKNELILSVLRKIPVLRLIPN